MISYIGAATKLFGNLSDANGESLSFIKASLPLADVRIPFRSYVSTIFLTCLVTYFSTIVALFLVLSYFELSFFLRVSYFIFFPFLAAVLAFGILAFYPYQKVSSRKKNIEMNLPFVLTHMGAIAESGVPPYVIFELIGRFKEYGEIAKEMQKITRGIKEYGSDPLTAVREVAGRTPSDSLRQVLNGFVSTTEAGGNVKTFLKNAGDQALFEWRIKREKFLQQLSAYAEFYTGLLIAAPLFIIALFAVMSMIQPQLGGYDIFNLMQTSIYIIVPLLNGVFLLFLKGVEVEI